MDLKGHAFNFFYSSLTPYHSILQEILCKVENEATNGMNLLVFIRILTTLKFQSQFLNESFLVLPPARFLLISVSVSF